MFLSCGCAIYLLFRSKALYIYQWCLSFGISDYVDVCRHYVQGCQLSDFIIFCLPDGLYCAAYILVIDAIWFEDNRLAKYLILSLVPTITIGSEILQLIGVVRGTFDVMDLVCYAISPLVYFVVYQRNHIIFDKLKTKNL